MDCTLVGATECTLGGQTSILSWASAPVSTWRGTWDFGRVIRLSAKELVSSGVDWHSDSRASVRGSECEIYTISGLLDQLIAGGADEGAHGYYAVSLWQPLGHWISGRDLCYPEMVKM